ncbi:retrovirus-related pol polyprotein from transposon TNT 1-94 [Tanacetum coccineum]|uniref:Retrovirus-related pol polyprotein from transposon TNT 1-94 n=1 Tax=Tanacetum coccineum TaxID=301880 RepID=A0ABQ4YAD3_9ASTR
MDDTDDEPEDKELEAHYMYMAKIQEVTPNTTDNVGPIFDDEPLQKVHNSDDDYNVFANERKHHEQLEYVNDTYLMEQGDTNIIHDPLDMSNNGEEADQDDQIQGKKQEVEDHLTYGKIVLNDNHDLCVLRYINGVNSRTKKPIVVPISTREPKRTVNQSVAIPHKKTVALESTIKKPRSTFRKLYQHVSKTCSWWYPKLTPPGYKWEPKSQSGNVNTNVSMPLGIESRTFNISEPKTVRVSTLSNTPLSSNSLQLIEIILFIVDSGCSKHTTGNLKLLVNFMEKFLGTVKFGNDQFAPILGYGDLVQGNVTIKRVYYVEGLNHNLFSVGQFCDVYLEVAFRKSTCYIRDLKGNDLLTRSRGTDLYSITLQNTTFSNPICLMAKATSSQAWLWHRRLSYLNFNTINLLSKNDIVIGILKLKFVKDHLCSSCELGKQNVSLSRLKQLQAQKDGYSFYYHTPSAAKTQECNLMINHNTRYIIEKTKMH